MKNRVLLALSLLLFSCSGMVQGLKWTAGFAGSLLSVAAGNYTPNYAEKIDKLIVAIEGSREEDKTGSVEEGADSGEPLRLDVAVQKQTKDEEGRRTFVTINDGDVLRDGRGDTRKGDRFRIVTKANRDCFLYIVGIDATAKVTTLFPDKDSGLENPVQKDKALVLPKDESKAFSIDERRGIEHIYFVASTRPLPYLDRIINDFLDLLPPPLQGSLQVEREVVVKRGVDEVLDHAKFVIDLATGREEVSFDSFISRFAKNALVVTRWFRHE